jgi:hypothetical protein
MKVFFDTNVLVAAFISHGACCELFDHCFYANDRSEVVHIHVERENMIAKFWVDPIRFQESGGFNRKELLKIQKIIEENAHRIMEAWNEYFND